MGDFFGSAAYEAYRNRKALIQDHYKNMNQAALDKATYAETHMNEPPPIPGSIPPPVPMRVQPPKYNPPTAQSYSTEQKKYTMDEDTNPSGPNNKTPDGENLELTAELRQYTKRKYRKIFTPYQNAVAGVPFMNPIESFLQTRLRSSKYFTPLPPLAYQRQIDVNSQYEQSVFY